MPPLGRTSVSKAQVSDAFQRSGFIVYVKEVLEDLSYLLSLAQLLIGFLFQVQQEA